jgi:GDP-L-fucose synthase
VEKAARVYVAGHNGLVGSALVRKLEKDGYRNLLLLNRSRLDLTRQADVFDFFHENRPDYVCWPPPRWEVFWPTIRRRNLYENLIMESNIIHASWQCGVKRLPGSSCISKQCPQPMRRTPPTGPLEHERAVCRTKIAAKTLSVIQPAVWYAVFLCNADKSLWSNDNFDLNRATFSPP